MRVTVSEGQRAVRRPTCYPARKVAIPLAFTKPWIADACYVVGAIMWLIPDRRIEKEMAHNAGTPPMSPRN